VLLQLINMHAQGDSLLPGELAGGKSGKNLRYTLPSVRGDLIRYVSGREEECHNIGLFSEIADQMILKLKDLVSTLQQHYSRGSSVSSCCADGWARCCCADGWACCCCADGWARCAGG
jgi:hypothetical protein